MDSVRIDPVVIEKILCACAVEYASDNTRIVPLFDREHGQFALIEEGWDGYQRIYEPLVHIEQAGTMVRLLADYTERGVWNDLIAAGVPEGRIELSYKHSSVRRSPVAA